LEKIKIIKKCEECPYAVHNTIFEAGYACYFNVKNKGKQAYCTTKTKVMFLKWQR